VIASANLPSLEATGSHGVQIVDPLYTAGLRSAVQLFLDDSFADAKTLEAHGVELPTWASFAQEIANWCER